MPKVRTQVRLRKTFCLDPPKNQSKKQMKLKRCVTLVILPQTLLGLTMARFFDEWNDDWSSVGWPDGWNESSINSASSLSLGNLILERSATLGGVDGENKLGHRSCSEHIPSELGSDRAGDGRFYKIAGGECFLDGRSFKATTKMAEVDL